MYRHNDSVGIELHSVITLYREVAAIYLMIKYSVCKTDFLYLN